MKREGIAIAGSLIVDHIKKISLLPSRSELTKIIDVEHSTGGCVCNTGMDLAILDSSLEIKSYGVVGDDNDGELIIDTLQKVGINTENVLKRGTTSFTDVYAETETGCRTFFQYGGACDTFDIGDIDIKNINAKIFHIGYLLLLESLDAADSEYGTKMARLLYEVKKQGCLTSIDVVSESGNRFKDIVCPVLKYVDYLMINEIEAGKITGIALDVKDNCIDEVSVKKALRQLLDMGVSNRVIIHASCGAYGMEKDGEYAFEPSKKLPKGYIVGTVGAGDAFCAGGLLAAYKDLPLKEALRYGNAAAQQALRSRAATGSMCDIKTALALYDEM